jgi:membrane protease YdiL (CAAX protease family)
MNESTLSISTGEGFQPNTTDCLKRIPFIPCRKISGRTVIWSIFLGLTLACPALVLLALFPVSQEAHQGALKSASKPLFAILTSIIVGPLLEEVIYRGLILQLARRYAPVWAAIVLSSAVFAATHLVKGAAVTLLAFPMGCLFAWMVVQRGSLYSAFLCHAAFNFAAFASGSLFGINEKILAHTPGSTFNLLTELFPVWWILLSVVMARVSISMFARESVGDRSIGSAQIAADVR